MFDNNILQHIANLNHQQKGLASIAVFSPISLKRLGPIIPFQKPFQPAG